MNALVVLAYTCLLRTLSHGGHEGHRGAQTAVLRALRDLRVPATHPTIRDTFDRAGERLIPSRPRKSLVAKNLQTVARRALTPCAATDAFRFADGGVARDLADLHHHVATKSSHLVLHHRDHYSAWVETILGDPALSRRIERLARKRNLDADVFRAELVLILEERIGKLRDRVL